MMKWNNLNSTSQLVEILEVSKSKPVLIFKHSTRCSISSMALNRLERNWKENGIEPYFLDLIQHREVSSQVEQDLGVIHQSPQAILLKDGRPIHNSSHNGIDFEEISMIANTQNSL